MPVRLKKLLGIFAILALVIVYAVFATAFASAYLADASGATHLVYFLTTGLLWIVPAAMLIKWMETEPRR